MGLPRGPLENMSDSMDCFRMNFVQKQQQQQEQQEEKEDEEEPQH